MASVKFDGGSARRLSVTKSPLMVSQTDGGGGGGVVESAPLIRIDMKLGFLLTTLVGGVFGVAAAAGVVVLGDV